MLFDSSYRTIRRPSQGLFRDRGSRFIAYAWPVKTEDEIKEHLQALKKEHPSARHHCYAYRLRPDKSVYRANDDGEPSNTGGKPILGQIKSNDLTNILVVVVRYFGGTLLGVPGLINAYRSAAADALGNAEIAEKKIEEIYRVSFLYPHVNDVMKIIKEESVRILSQDFSESCSLVFSVTKEKADLITGSLKRMQLSIEYLEAV
jgi:uncharacterized YigZ family protein